MPDSKRLVWDKTGERFYEAGVRHGVLYPQDSTGSYPKGVVWNGLTAVTDSPSGAESNDLWADNIKYGSLRSAETAGMTIEAYTYPPEFAACDGSATVAPGVYIRQQTRQPFGFSYETLIGNDTASEEDDGFTLHLVYNCTASPSERNHETLNDSPDAIVMSWEIETTPVNVEGYKPSSVMELNSLTADPVKFKTLLDILYGSDSVEARLPSMEEVISIMESEPEAETY